PLIEQFTDALTLLKEEGCEVVPSPFPPPVLERDLLKLVPGVDAVIAGGDEFTGQVIEAASHLKLIARYGVGVEKIDLEAATKNRVAVTIAPNQNAVADFVFALLLGLARKICQGSELTKSGKWE